MTRKKKVQAVPRTVRAKKPRIVRLDAIYLPKANYGPRCPKCFSHLSIAGRIAKGWGVALTEKFEIVDPRSGLPVAIFEFRYPCSNPECFTEIMAYASATGLRLSAFRPVMEWPVYKKYKSGVTGQDGIWRVSP